MASTKNESQRRARRVFNDGFRTDAVQLSEAGSTSIPAVAKGETSARQRTAEWPKVEALASGR